MKDTTIASYSQETEYLNKAKLLLASIENEMCKYKQMQINNTKALKRLEKEVSQIFRRKRDEGDTSYASDISYACTMMVNYTSSVNYSFTTYCTCTIKMCEAALRKLAQQ